MSDTTPVDLDDLRFTDMTDDQHKEFIGMGFAIKDLYRITEEQNRLMTTNTNKLDQIYEILTKSKGAWAVITVVGTALAAILGYFVSHLHLPGGS